MKILLREAFSETMPNNIRNWMKQYGNTYSRKFTKNRASLTKDFDPASAEFQDVSHLSVNALREYLKAGTHVIFAEVETDRHFRPVTIAIYSDSSNSTNKLKLIGDNANYFKEKSFKWIIENAKSVYATPINEEIPNVRAARQNTRKGLISRAGQSAQSSNPRWSFHSEDWKQDASGYWYDANRLAAKLAKMHMNDVGYYTKKAANIFVNMANAYADAIKEMAQQPDLDFSTFGERGFEYISREGQRLLSNAGEKMRRLKEEAEYYAYTLEQVNAKRSENGAEPLTEEEYNESQEYHIDQIMRYLTEIEEKNRELKSLIV